MSADPIVVQPLSLELLGVSIEISSQDEEVRSAVADLWAPFIATSPGTPDSLIEIDGIGEWRAEILDRGQCETADIWELLDRVCAAIFQYVVSAAPGILDIHAAVLQRDEQVVILAGAPGVGKTTLTLELLGRGGWVYLSDDLAPIHLDSGLVGAFPKPFSVKDSHRWDDLAPLWKGASSLPVPKDRFVLPGQAFPLRANGAIRPSHMLFPTRGKSEVRHLPTAKAIFRLGAYVSRQRMDPTSVGLLHEVCGAITLAEIVYAEVGHGADLVESLVS